MSNELTAAGGNPELRPIMTIRESNEFDLEVAKRDDYYRVLLHNDVQLVPIMVKTSAWVLDENRLPVLKDGKRIRRNAADAGLDVWAANGPEEYTLQVVMLGSVVVATVESIAKELGLRERFGKE